jgi:hypothetical protein
MSSSSSLTTSPDKRMEPDELSDLEDLPLCSNVFSKHVLVDGTQIPPEILKELFERKIPNTLNVIEASRKTDMATGDLWKNFFESLKRGYTFTFNPRYIIGAKAGEPVCKSRAYSIRLIDADHTHFLSLWTKDAGKFLQILKDNPSYKKLLFSYPAFHFSYALNGYCPILEPGVKKTLKEKLQDMTDLVSLIKEMHGSKIPSGAREEKTTTIGEEKINPADFFLPHFDPIVIFRKTEDNKETLDKRYICPFFQEEKKGVVYWNLDCIEEIFSHVHKLLSTKEPRILYTISFCELNTWKHVKKQMISEGIDPLILTLQQKQQVLDYLLPLAGKYGIVLQTCNNLELVGYKSSGKTVQRSTCLRGEKINRFLKLIGKPTARTKQSTKKKNCTCIETFDIIPNTDCIHKCVYCFARKKMGQYTMIFKKST